MSRIPSQREYEEREYKEFKRQLLSTLELSKKDKLEARAELLEALRNDPKLVAQRINWMIDGNYGYGAYRQAWSLIDRPRANRAAWMVQTIGALEWQVYPNDVVTLWKQLTPSQKQRLEEEVKKVIHEAAEDEERPVFD